MSIYSQLNDLYQLQIAASALEHGIKTTEWILFEPSKFVYAFFTFNSFYSINWEETKKQNKLIKWGINRNTDLEEKSKTDRQKIREMLKYICKSYIKDNNEEIGKESIANELVVKFKKIFSQDIEKNMRDLNNIVTDDTIDEVDKTRFIENFKNLYESKLRGKDFKNKLEELLHFISEVRNNIFHGTKTVTKMMGEGQQRRLKIYTGILLAINEMLFDVNEKNFEWMKSKFNNNLKLNNGRVQHMFLSNTAFSKFKVEIPNGSLFYPCCGDDTYLPLELFIDKISEFHFVDIVFLPFLPKLECQIEGFPDPIQNRRSMRSNYSNKLITKEIISNAKTTRIERDAVNKAITYKQEWLYTPQECRKIGVYRHIQDGLKVFKTLDNISVFFLVGDSAGEGGSGQRWFQEKLFDLILDKLIDGGLIVTDGSGLDWENTDSAIWKPLWSNRDAGENNNLPKPENFNYKGRKFVCIEKCGYRYGPVYIWKVIKATI